MGCDSQFDRPPAARRRKRRVAPAAEAKIELRQPLSAPATEWSVEFLQGMVDRMSMAYHSYGAIAEAYPHKVDAVGGEDLEDLGCVGQRLNKYKLSGNREYLIDAANFLMIEFMRPGHPEAYFAGTDSRQSPGRKWHGERDPSSRGNREP